MYVYLRAKCDVSSIILTKFRQGVRGGGQFNLPITSKQDPKKYTQIRVKLVVKFALRVAFDTLQYFEICSKNTDVLQAFNSG